MSKKKFKDTAVGKFISDKVKPIAGDVLEFVGNVTGIEAIDKVGEFLNAKAEEDAQFKALQIELEEKRMEWELEFRRMEIEELQITLADTQNARSREVEFMQANGGKRDWVQGGLVIFNMAILATMLVFLAMRTVPEANVRIFDMLLGGVVVSGSQAIFQYYFGSSRGSRQKDDIIKNLNK
jgi:hypothetical protein